MTTSNKSRANTPQLTLEDATKAFNATYAYLTKSVDGKRSINRVLLSHSETDDGTLHTFKLPLASAVVIRKVARGFQRDAFDIDAFDVNGRPMTVHIKTAKEVFPTLEKALNSASISYGRGLFTSALNAHVDSSVKTTRSRASDVEVTAQRERADAAEQRATELEARIAQLEALLNNK